MATRQCYPFPENLDEDKVNEVDSHLGELYFLFNQSLEKWFRIELQNGWIHPHIEMEVNIEPNGERWQPEFWSVWIDKYFETAEDAIEFCQNMEE